MAQERIAEATPSASSRSSGSPFWSVRVRRAYTDLERWVRWAAGPKTLRPKTWFAGAVRSGDPSCPPFGLHCAAARLRWAVVDKLSTPWTWLADSTVERGAGDALVRLSKIWGGGFANVARRQYSMANKGPQCRPGGESRYVGRFRVAMRPQVASRDREIALLAARQH